jgi:hypothetical protein
MQRRYRVLRTRRGHLLKVPPPRAVTTGPLVPPLIHRHRNARYRPHRGRHLTRAPILIPPPPGIVLSAGPARWNWTAGGARNS